MSLHISYVAGCKAVSPKNTWQNTPQASSFFFAASQLFTGSTCYLASRRLVSAKEESVTPPRIPSHPHAKISASDPADGERSGNRKTFMASPTPSRSSEKKLGLIRGPQRRERCKVTGSGGVPLSSGTPHPSLIYPFILIEG